jgi:cysteine synthase A
MKTPLYAISSKSPPVFAKAEFETVTGSGKYRIATALVADALKRNPRAVGVVDATSGGTGKSIAHVAGKIGKATRMFMPESYRSRAAMVESEGGTVELVPGGMAEATEQARLFAQANPGYIYTAQFDSPINVERHRLETAHEILADLPGRYRRIWVVAGSGTGGTLVGVTRGLADLGIDVGRVCAVPVDRKGAFSTRIAGVADRASRFIDWDEIETVLIDDEAALARCRALIREQGLNCGPSSGLNVLAAEYVALCRARSEDCVVTFLPDRRENYDFLSDEQLGIDTHRRLRG